MKYIVSSIALFILFLITPHTIFAQDTIHVEAGWNMIGAKSTMLQSGFTSEPLGIITSQYYGYKSGVGYSPADTLRDGKGFWVKATQAGMLIGGPTAVKSCGEVVIYGGRVYNTVLIGSQCWFMQNLDIGTMITGTTEQSNNSTIEKYCFNDNPANCTTYGGLYQWNEAMQYTTVSGGQGICPTGWHIPTYGEIQTLATTVGNDGNALKAVGQGTGGGSGTNTSGYSALLSGDRGINGYFYYLGFSPYFWSSTEYSATNAYYLYLYNGDSGINFYDDSKSYGFSVRCLKD